MSRPGPYRLLLTAFLLSTLNATAIVLSAQDEPPRSGVFLRVGGGLAHATASNTNGSHNSATGPLAALHLGVGGRRVQALLEVQWPPFKVRLPEGTRAVRMVYFLGSVQWFVQRQVYVRGGLGVVHQGWSDGAGDDSGGALGATVGVEARVLGRWLAFEGLWRGTYSLCFGECSFAGTRLLAVQVLVPFY